MKRTLLVLFLILSLLVSCATKTTNNKDNGVTPNSDSADAASEFSDASPAYESSDAENDSDTEDSFLEASEDASFDFVDGSEDPFADFVFADFDFYDEPETFAEVEAEPEVVEDAIQEEYDWSKAFEMPSDSDIDWDAPIAERPQEDVETPVEEAPAAQESETIPEQETPALVEVFESAPIVEVPVEAEPESGFVGSLKSFVEKLGKFVMREKLFSLGVLTCIVGFVYLIISLIKTSEASLDKKYYKVQEKSRKVESKHSEDVEVAAEKPETPKTEDVELSGEDDEFLKSLLGDN